MYRQKNSHVLVSHGDWCLTIDNSVYSVIKPFQHMYFPPFGEKYIVNK